jgi:hypothetical protein
VHNAGCRLRALDDGPERHSYIASIHRVFKSTIQVFSLTAINLIRQVCELAREKAQGFRLHG